MSQPKGPTTQSAGTDEKNPNGESSAEEAKEKKTPTGPGGGIFVFNGKMQQKEGELEKAKEAFDEEFARLAQIDVGPSTEGEPELEGKPQWNTNALFEANAPLAEDLEQDELEKAKKASLDDEKEGQVPGEGQEEEPDISDAAIDLVASTKEVFAKLGKVDPNQLEANVAKMLGDPMDKRIKALPSPEELMDEKSFAVYTKNFMTNPFETLGQVLKENQAKPEKALDLVDFMVRGAQCAAIEMARAQEAKTEAGQNISEMEKAKLLDLKAKLMALEEVQSVLNSLIALEKNNCRYSKAEYAKKVAQIQAMLSKTDIGPETQVAFARQMRDVLENFKYDERMTVGSAIAKKVKRNSSQEYVANRGRNEFDTRQDSLAFGKDTTKKGYIKERLLHPETIAKLNTIKVGHSEQGKVVHLSFSFDRTKILKGNAKEYEKMRLQLGDALTISISDYGKGTMDNPISVAYRPPTLIQPEVAFTMLMSLKEKAIEQGKSFYVKDPNNPDKTIEFTSKPEVSEHEMACLNHYARELGTGARCDVVELLYNENLTDEQFHDYLNDHCQKFHNERKEDTAKKDSEIVKDYDKSKKMKT